MIISLSKVQLFLKRNAVAIILAFLPPLVFWYYFERELSSVTVTLVSDVSVVSVDRNYAKDIEVKYKSLPISTLRVLDIKVENSGSRPITRADYDSTLTFSFTGSSITPPDLVEARPSSLHPTFRRLDSLTLAVDPILLNAKDYFVFRTFVVNGKAGELPLKVTARLIGVSDVRIVQASTEASQDKGPDWLVTLMAVLTAILSILSIFYLWYRYKNSVFSFPVNQAMSLSDSINSSSSTPKAVEELAQQLDIREHDFKTSMLLLRISLESQLRAIARKAGLPPSDAVGSITKMARQFQLRGLITDQVASAILDLAPIMNREMHDSDTYLTEQEFLALQTLALKTIIALKAAFLKVKHQAQANGG